MFYFYNFTIFILPDIRIKNPFIASMIAIKFELTNKQFLFLINFLILETLYNVFWQILILATQIPKILSLLKLKTLLKNFSTIFIGNLP